MTPTPELSRRETQLFNLLGRHGLSKAQAAQVMKIERLTVKSHLSRVAKRFQSRNSPNTLHILIEKGLVTAEPLPRRFTVPYAQRVVLQEIAKGYENPEISERTGLTIPQVQYTIKRLYKALPANNRIQAVYRGHQLGYLTNNRRNT